MIPFYRKIRKRLADDNQFLKYSRYAIGEILLVVVGILLALQINTWNENKKLDSIRKEYYLQLLEDLDIDEKEMNELIVQLELKIEKYNDYIETFKKPSLTPLEVAENLSKLNFNYRYFSFGYRRWFNLR